MMGLQKQCTFMFIAMLAASCSCQRGIGITGQGDAADLAEPDEDLSEVALDIEVDPIEEPDIPEMLLECEEAAGAWSMFMVDDTDWPRDLLDFELFCETDGSDCSETARNIRLHCMDSEGTTSYHYLSIAALPDMSGLWLLDLTHMFHYSAVPAFRANRYFTLTAPWGELGMAGIEVDSLLDEELVVGPFRVSAAHDSCMIDGDSMGDPERIAVNVVCGATVVSIFDGNTAEIDCPETYQIVVGEAVKYHEPVEYGPEWPDTWFSVLIFRVH
jgi:hypothetical protein